MALLPGTVKTARDGVLVVKDAATPTANSMTVALDMGDISISKKQNITQIKDRGALDHFRLGEEEAVVVSFTGFYTGLAHGSNVTLWDAMWQDGNAAAWVSTTDGASDVFTVDLELTYTDVDGSSTETVKCANFGILEFKLDEAIDGNKISVSGVCKATDLTIS
jgi:hypothetical protein